MHTYIFIYTVIENYCNRKLVPDCNRNYAFIENTKGLMLLCVCVCVSIQRAQAVEKGAYSMHATQQVSHAYIYAYMIDMIKTWSYNIWLYGGLYL